MKQLLFIFFFSFISVNTFAQDYLIKVHGDTLSGEISLLPNGKLPPYVQIKNGEGKERIDMFDIRSIYLADEGVVKPLKVGTTYQFGLLVKSGYLSLYKYSNNDRLHDFAYPVLQKMDGTSMEVPGIFGFKKYMIGFLEDCENVTQKIEDKVYTKNDLETIVDEYNTCIQMRDSVVATSQVVPKKSSLDKDLESLINDFKALLKYSDKVDNRSDVQQMFTDYVNKIESGETPPNYLINGIKEGVSKDDKLKDIFNKITEKR